MSLDHLNLHHLLYFRAVAREGGVARAAAHLHVSAPTVSAQVKQLEDQVGDALFLRTGRRLVLTALGRTVLHYADGIFDLAEELRGVVRSGHEVLATRLTVGLSMAVPKLIAHRLLEPALTLEQPVELVCIEDKPEALLAGLATHSIDLVLSDAPRGAEVAVRAFDHKLGECGVTFFATAPLARKLRPGFPRSLDGAPMLLPTAHAAVRTSLEHWFQDLDIRPRAVASFDDSALLKVFGATGSGVFAVPSAIEQEVERQYPVRPVGRVEEVRERFYAVSIERRLRHPAVVAISQGAREELFPSRTARR
ncbi:MAG: LysR family transcriptional regulator [Myxococcota bacterium]